MRSPKESDYWRRVSQAWYDSLTLGERLVAKNQGPVAFRLALLDAYAAADPDTRRRWAEETRQLTAKPEEA